MIHPTFFCFFFFLLLPDTPTIKQLTPGPKIGMGNTTAPCAQRCLRVGTSPLPSTLWTRKKHSALQAHGFEIRKKTPTSAKGYHCGIVSVTQDFPLLTLLRAGIRAAPSLRTIKNQGFPDLSQLLLL